MVAFLLALGTLLLYSLAPDDDNVPSRERQRRKR